MPIGPSSSTAAAHRATGSLRQRPGGTPARVLVPSAAVRSGGAIGVGRAAAAWQQAAKQHAAPNLRLVVDTFPRRLLTGRAARARYSARTRERRGVRANWPPLTRPTVRGLAVVCSSPHARSRMGKLPCGAPLSSLSYEKERYRSDLHRSISFVCVSLPGINPSYFG